MTTKRLSQAFAVAVLIVVAAPMTAMAHAGFVSSNPEPGSTLGSAPGQVTMTFSEPPNPRLSRASVQMPDGSSISGRVTGDDTMLIDLTTNQSGVYEVKWTTVSLVDGHTLSGNFQFGVGVSPGAAAQGSTSDEPTGWDLLVAAGRLVEDTSLLLVLGLLLLGSLASRRPSLAWVRTPTRWAFAAALAGGVTVVLGEALLAAGSVSATDALAYLTEGVPGWSRLARVVLEAAGLLVAFRWPRGQAPFAVAAMIGLAAAGHAAAVRPQAWGVSVEAIHLVSAGVWAGGILALAIQRPPAGWFGGEGRALLDRFTPPALIAFGVTTLTGVVRAVQEVGSPTALFTSSYGIVLLVKVLAVATLIQFSIFAWRRIAIHVRMEAVVAAVAVGAAALLSAFPLPPARQGESSEERQAASAVPPVPAGEGLTLGARAGPVLVGLTVQPGVPGTNELTVYVLSADGPQATAALPVQVSVDGKPVSLSQCADSCRNGTAQLSGGDLVVVDVGTGSGSRVVFRLPPLPTKSGEGSLHRMLASMGSLTSYRLSEELTSGLGTTVRSTYAFVAPNSFQARTVEAGQAFQTVWIGDTRYTRESGAAWKVEQGAPAVPVPTFVWDSFPPYRDVRIVGSATVQGVRTTELAFAGGGQDLPVWFRLWVDAQGHVRQAQMRAPGHFMDHRYYDFDAPIKITPPEGAKG